MRRRLFGYRRHHANNKQHLEVWKKSLWRIRRLLGELAMKTYLYSTTYFDVYELLLKLLMNNRRCIREKEAFRGHSQGRGECSFVRKRSPFSVDNIQTEICPRFSKGDSLFHEGIHKASLLKVCGNSLWKQEARRSEDEAPVLGGYPRWKRTGEFCSRSLISSACDTTFLIEAEYTLRLIIELHAHIKTHVLASSVFIIESLDIGKLQCFQPSSHVHMLPENSTDEHSTQGYAPFD